MVTIIFRMKINDDKEEPALEALRKMVAAVEAQEPSTLAYAFHRPKDDPAEVVLYEHYADEAALQSHMQTPHMAELRSSLNELFDMSQIKAERLERVAGFVRAS